MEKRGKLHEAMRCYLLAGDHDTALKIAISILRTIVSQETWDPFEAYAVIQMMGSAKYA